MKIKPFRDKKGNRMIFPSQILWGKETDPNKYDVDTHLSTFQTMTHGVTVEDWIEVDENVFPHVSGEVGSNIFQHGRASVYIFEGPDFDEAMKEQQL